MKPDLFVLAVTLGHVYSQCACAGTGDARQLHVARASDRVLEQNPIQPPRTEARGCGGGSTAHPADVGRHVVAQEINEMPLDSSAFLQFSITTDLTNESNGEPTRQSTGESAKNASNHKKKDPAIKDENDLNIAESSGEATEALDSNSTVKDKVKDKVRDAIEDGAQEAKEDSFIVGDGDENLTMEERHGGKKKVKAKQVIRSKVDQAIENSVREAMQEYESNQSANATSASNHSNASAAHSASGKGTATSQKTAEAKSEEDAHKPTRPMPLEEEVAGKRGVDAHRSGNASQNTNVTKEKVIKAIKEKVTEAIDERANTIVHEEHRQPTEHELQEAADEEIDRIFDILRNAKRFKSYEDDYPFGIGSFWMSVAFFDWFLLMVAIVVSLVVFGLLIDWPSKTAFHSAALFIWLGIGVMYNSMIFVRLGVKDGIIWMSGYILEIIFLIENVFVFHVVVSAFNLTRKAAQKAMFVVVACQIVFQMVFYMGLAKILRGMEVLPYILGPWLIYCGHQASMEDDNHHFDILESRVVKAFKVCLGDRLALEKMGSATTRCNDIIVTKSGKKCCSTFGLAVFCLLIADFLLEIDVTVTKIENLPNQYLCFSSSVVASFTVPELFFVARDLFRAFFLLKYAISFVLVYFGVQMILHRVFAISALTNILTIIAVLLFSVFFSALFRCGPGYETASTPANDEGREESNSDPTNPTGDSEGSSTGALA
eukprot:CAMPEP_0117540048 /NCGR_PEP_ID=MMETSP0784-20121206/43299_1 /TAXON_ID=39447 /ORGANISM="" /LENGTH=715 /DNA_ID=CAMNT_0005336693 /DNA_START=25 /DNA_END=2172 /DNA_ORIENTATION=+